MAHTGYWIAAVDGDTITDKTAHDDRGCAEAGDRPARPDSTSRVEREDMDLCSDCVGNGDGSDGGGDGEPATCDVVKNDGEVCGRERPCPYHD